MCDAHLDTQRLGEKIPYPPSLVPRPDRRRCLGCGRHGRGLGRWLAFVLLGIAWSGSRGGLGGGGGR